MGRSLVQFMKNYECAISDRLRDILAIAKEIERLTRDIDDGVGHDDDCSD